MRHLFTVCPFHDQPIGPPPARNCPSCRDAIRNTVAEPPLPDWLQDWRCPVCDLGYADERCECDDIQRAVQQFRETGDAMPQRRGQGRTGTE